MWINTYRLNNDSSQTKGGATAPVSTKKQPEVKCRCLIWRRAGSEIPAVCAGGALSLFVEWIRRTWKLSRPSAIHYVWGAWRHPLNFCSGGIRWCSQVEMLAGHLKHTICGNISTWKHSTRLEPYSSICRLKYMQHNQFFHRGHRGGLLGQQGVEGLVLPSMWAPLLKLLLAI